MSDPRAGTVAQPPTSSTWRTSSRPTTRGARTPPTPTSGWPSAPRAIAAAASTPRSTRRTSWPPRRRSATTARAGVRRPAVRRTRHARAVRAGVGLRARGARRQRRDRPRRRPRRLHADARGVARDPARQPGQDVQRPGRRHRGHAVAQPAARRRLQVQPAQRRPGGHRRHEVDRRHGERLHRGRPLRRATDPLRAGACSGRAVRLPGDLRRRPAERRGPREGQGGRGADRSGPARRRVGGLLGRDRRPARSGPDGGEPAGGPDVAVHDARLGRQDPDGLLLAVGDGVADRPQGRVRHRHRQRRGLRPARHRHPRRRPDEPEPLPRGRDRLPVRRWAAVVAGERRDRQDAGVLLDDRPGRRPRRADAHRGPGRVQVVRARPARRLDRVRWRGVRRRVVPALRRLGVDHRQGRDHPGPAGLGDPRRDRAGRPRSTTPTSPRGSATRRTPASTRRRTATRRPSWPRSRPPT